MSHQSFVDFMKNLQQDGALQQQLQSQLGDPAQGIAVEGLAQFAAGKGYQFDVAEVQSELSDQQLGAVTGGLFDVFTKVESIPMVKFTYKTFPKNV